MIRSILFPTDFSEVANGAFPLATALAAACGAKILALHVSSSATRRSVDPQHDFPEPLDHSVRLERSMISKSKTEGYADVIIRKALRRECDLIVMASHGRSDVAQFFLGRSVAERVMLESPTPAITIRPFGGRRGARPLDRITRLAYVTDLTPASHAVLPAAAAIARGLKIPFDVITALGEGDARLADGGRAEVEKLLSAHFSPEEAEERRGNFAAVRGGANAVAERAAGDNVDLLAITATLGSGARPDRTAQHLIRNAPCAVLCLNPQVGLST
jgi:nucleotide-binding universal stress UspA family protein